MKVSAKPTQGEIKADRPNGVPIAFPSVVPTRLYPKAKVTVDFQHDRLADLVIRLEAPDGTRLPLLTRTGRGAHDGPMSFEVDLSEVKQQNGVWRVVVLDFQAGDGGLVREAEIDFPENSFRIVANYEGITASQRAIYEGVVAGWEGRIIGVQGVDQWVLGLDLTMIPIDGEGQILGQAGPTLIDLQRGLPKRGQVQLDTADGGALEAANELGDIVDHEIGHCVFLYQGWQWHTELVDGRFWVGEHAMEAYGRILGKGPTPVPLEDGGGAGTAMAHLDEEVFRRAKMTGYYDSGFPNPFTEISIQALRDIGWLVDPTRFEEWTPSLSLMARGSDPGRRHCRIHNAPTPEFV